MSEVAAEAAAASTSTRPKSKKELRAERKAAKKAEAEADASAAHPTSTPTLSPAEIKERNHRLKKERRKEMLKEREREARREMRREKKIRKRTRQRRGLHATGGGLDPKAAADQSEQRRRAKKRRRDNDHRDAEDPDRGRDRTVFDKVFNGTGDEDESGARTLEMGVKCMDVVVGEGGNVARNNSLVTVAYKLTGGKSGVVIDSSKKFVFRVGKGEVIRGWDIGVVGMAVGGRRKLIVPPKAGYGGQNIGAGPGALLHFDITVLSCT